MGAYLSEPIKSKESEDGAGNNLTYGAASMQGWRVSQEDAHNCLLHFERDKSSFFAVYDGHGGAEIATYLSRKFPDVLRNTEAFISGDMNQALIEAFLKIDASIKEPEVLSEIHKIAKMKNGEGEESAADYEDENVGELYEEATMPLDKLMAKYQASAEAAANKSESDASSSAGPSPSSSKIVSKSVVAEERKESESKTVEEVKTVVEEASGAAAATPKDLATANDVSTVNGRSSSCLPASSDGKNSTTSAALSGSSSVNDTSSCNGEVEDSKSNSTGLNGIDSKNNDKLEANQQEICSVQLTTTTVIEVTDKEIKPSVEGPKPRKGKVHPVPVIVAQPDSSKRVSPRKTKNPPTAAFAPDTDSDTDDSDEPAEYKKGDSDDGNSTSGSEEEDDSDEDDEDDEDDDDDEDDTFLNDIQEPGYDSGSTAVVAFTRWDASKLHLWVANAGDSRCVVSRKGEALDMSYDHKPESEPEALRIVKAGGKVTEDGRVNGGLNLSRAIGDHSYKANTNLPPEEQMISPLPSIQHVELDPEQDDFIVLACDGVWNSMTSQEVVDFVSERIVSSTSLSKICEEMFDACLASDTYGDGTGCDNMTAIIIQLGKNPRTVKRCLSPLSNDNESSKKRKLDETA